MNIEQLSKQEKYINGEEAALDYLEKNKTVKTEADWRKMTVVYSPEEVMRDKAQITKTKTGFEKKPTKDKEGKEIGFENKESKDSLAHVFEASLLYGINRAGWAGDKISAQATTSYDDFYHHVDGIMEFEGSTENKYSALSLDATYGTDKLKIKLERIAREIEDKKLGQIKYFISANEDYAGGLKNIPRLVITATAERVKEMESDWENLSKAFINDSSARLQAQIKQGKISKEEAVTKLKELKEKEKDSVKNFADSSYKFQFLEEIIMQADFFDKFARKNNFQTNVYADLKNKFSAIYEQLIVKRDDKGEIKTTTKMSRNDKNELIKTKEPHLADDGLRDNNFYALKTELGYVDETIKVNSPFNEMKQRLNKK